MGVLIQLFVIHLFSLGIVGRIIFFFTEKNQSFVAFIVATFFNSAIAYYYSESINRYAQVNGTNHVITIFAFILIVFMYLGPMKYVEKSMQKGTIILSSVVSILFFILIRFAPFIGEYLFYWLPVYVWV